MRFFIVLLMRFCAGLVTNKSQVRVYECCWRLDRLGPNAVLVNFTLCRLHAVDRSSVASRKRRVESRTDRHSQGRARDRRDYTTIVCENKMSAYSRYAYAYSRVAQLTTNCLYYPRGFSTAFTT